LWHFFPPWEVFCGSSSTATTSTRNNKPNVQLFRYQQMRLFSTGQRATTELGASGASLASCAVDLPRGRQCMDPRDRVYAMLALTGKGTRITPNYNLPFRSVRLDFTTQSLLGGESFLLHASGICPSHDGTLPSFVPNIEDSAGMPLPLDSHEFKFSTAVKFPVSIKLKAINSISIRGIQIGRLRRCVGPVTFLFSVDLGLSEKSICRMWEDRAKGR
jgi:hypothetical protein